MGFLSKRQICDVVVTDSNDREYKFSFPLSEDDVVLESDKLTAKIKIRQDRTTFVSFKGNGLKIKSVKYSINKALKNFDYCIQPDTGREYCDALSPLRDRKSTRLNSSHIPLYRMPSAA